MGCGFSSPEAARGPASTRDQIIGRRTTHGSEPLDRSVFITATENGEWAPPCCVRVYKCPDAGWATLLFFRMGGTNAAGGDDNVGIDRPLSAPNGGSTKVRQGSRRRGTAQAQLAVPQRRIRYRIASARFSPTGIALARPIPASGGGWYRDKRERERGEKAPSKSSKQAQPFTSKAIQEQHPYPFLFLFLLLQGSKPTHEYEHRELHPYHHSPPSLTVYVHVHSTRVYGVPSNR